MLLFDNQCAVDVAAAICLTLQLMLWNAILTCDSRRGKNVVKNCAVQTISQYELW